MGVAVPGARQEGDHHIELAAEGTNAISMHSYLQIMSTGIQGRTFPMLTPSRSLVRVQSQSLWPCLRIVYLERVNSRVGNPGCYSSSAVNA